MLFEKNINAIGTGRSNRKQMLKMTGDKKMKKGESNCLSSNKVVACKWMDKQPALLLLTALKGLNNFSTIQRREKGSKSISAVDKFVKLHKNGMGGVNHMNQNTT